MYITLQEYKDMMGIQWTDPILDAQINIAIIQTKSMLDKIIWDLTFGVRKEKVKYQEIFFIKWVVKVHTSKVNISSVISIDGEPYTDDFSTDGKLDHIVYIKPPYRATEYPYMEIEVENWFETIPDDLKLLQVYMVKDLLDARKGLGIVTKKKIWDKELQFSNNTAETIKNYISDVILSYSIISL